LPRSHPFEQGQGCIDARARRFPLVTDDAQLRVAAAEKEAGTSPAPVLVFIVPGTVAPVVRAPIIRFSIPFLADLTPVAPIIVIAVTR
jgi:hypothetical protein